MVLTVRELELLKLLCWCRTIPPSEVWFSEIYRERDLRLMEHLGFAEVSRNGKYIRPRPGAYDLLRSVGYSFYGDVTPQTKQQSLDRWNMSARILLTFYLSGVDVFADNIEEKAGVYLSALAAKNVSVGKPFGSTKFHGIFRTSEVLYLVFYIDGDGIYFQKELALFHSYTDRIPTGRTGLIFMGESLSEIGEVAFQAEQNEEQATKKKYHADSFAKVFAVTSLPVHFVPIGKSGARTRLSENRTIRPVGADGVLAGTLRRSGGYYRGGCCASGAGDHGKGVCAGQSRAVHDEGWEVGGHCEFRGISKSSRVDAAEICGRRGRCAV